MLILMLASIDVAALPPPSRLLVEGLEPEVAVISVAAPHFSFVHQDDPAPAPPALNRRGTVQRSYRITVTALSGGESDDAGAANATTVLWDSGDVNSSRCSQIAYAGAALKPFARYQWTVTWTASTGLQSEPARAVFETGPMAQADWHGAPWLTGGQVRYELTLPAGSVVEWARAYVAAVGCHSLVVNGQIPSPDLRGICPWPVNGKNIRYQTHNLSAMLRPGTNGLGLLNGQVMASRNQALMVVIVVHLRGNLAPMIVTSGHDGWKESGSYISGCMTSHGLNHCDMHHDRVQQAWATTVDWTRHDPLWSLPRYNTSGWAKAATRKSSNPALALAMPLSTVLSEVKPIEVTTTPDGAWLYTFPKNLVGTIRLAPLPSALPGAVISVQLGEWLDVERQGVPAHPPPPPCTTKPQTCPGHANRNRTFCASSTSSDQCDKPMPHPPCPPCPPSPSPTPPVASNSSTWPTISGGQLQYEDHILRPGNKAPLETIFCWHGFQYVRVTPYGNHTGFTGTLDSIIALEIHTNMSSAGTLSFGGDGTQGSTSEHAAAVLAGIQAMTLQSQRTNVAAYMPTDCPTREKHGWLGDALDASDEALYNFNIMPVHANFVQLIEESQGTGGDVPVVIPSSSPGQGSCGDIAWTAAYPLITHDLYTYYGDLAVVRRHWSSLVHYADNLIARARGSPSHLAECDQFQDWLCSSPATGANASSCCTNSSDLVGCPVAAEMGSFSYVLVLRAMASMAAALGDAVNATGYSALATNASEAFHHTFWDDRSSTYGNDPGGTQSLTLPALQIGAPPAALKPRVVQNLQDDLENRTDYHLAVGAVTGKILLNVLSEHGLHSSAMRVATQTTEPSWGYWWSQNSSTCWEAFPENEKASGHTPQGETTKNHIFLCGGIGEWYWKHLVGLTPAAPGFASIKLAPQLDCDYGPHSLNASYLSASGRISSSWAIHLANGTISMEVSLPVGVQTAIVIVPKPFVASGSTNVSHRVASATVSESGRVVWDGERLLNLRGTGIESAEDRADGVALSVLGNGVYSFVASDMGAREKSRRPWSVR